MAAYQVMAVLVEGQSVRMVTKEHGASKSGSTNCLPATRPRVRRGFGLSRVGHIGPRRLSRISTRTRSPRWPMTLGPRRSRSICAERIGGPTMSGSAESRATSIRESKPRPKKIPGQRTSCGTSGARFGRRFIRRPGCPRMLSYFAVALRLIAGSVGHIPVHVVPDAYFRDHQTPLISEVPPIVGQRPPRALRRAVGPSPR
jgi:hypothetical protein